MYKENGNFCDDITNYKKHDKRQRNERRVQAIQECFIGIITGSKIKELKEKPR